MDENQLLPVLKSANCRRLYSVRLVYLNDRRNLWWRLFFGVSLWSQVHEFSLSLALLAYRELFLYYANNSTSKWRIVKNRRKIYTLASYLENRLKENQEFYAQMISVRAWAFHVSVFKVMYFIANKDRTIIISKDNCYQAIRVRF